MLGRDLQPLLKQSGFVVVDQTVLQPASEGWHRLDKRFDI